MEILAEEAVSKLKLKKRSSIVLIGMVVLIIMSLVPTIDTLSDKYINDAFVEAGIIYGSARLMNSLVSVFQTVDISIFFASVGIGEAFDPLNDLIERFSLIMTMALASLGLQKILVVIGSDNVFNILLILLAVLYGRCVLVGTTEFRSGIAKSFFTLVVLRFSIALIIILNATVDTLFLKEQIAQNQAQITAFNSLLQNTSDSLTQAKGAAITKLEAEVSELVNESEKWDERIKNKKDELAKLEKQKGWGFPFGNDSGPEVLVLKERIGALKNEIEDMENQQEKYQSRIDKKMDQITCELKKAKGESCNWTDWWDEKTELSLSSKIDEVFELTSKIVESIVLQLALMVLKSILFPLLFLFIIYKQIQCLWRLDNAVFAS